MARNEIGVFEAEVLRAILAIGADSYGLSIGRSIEDATGRKVSLGAVYTTLERLEAKGLVDSGWGEATAVRGGRRKRLYTVSGKGQFALNRPILSGANSSAIGRPVAAV